MAKGYWIARVDVRDSERYKDYVSTAKPAFERFGANFLARGGALTELEGKARARNVVIEFPSVQHAIDCYNSPEYQAAAKIRQEVADAEMVIVEGI
ncbi:DUF1330 domain-containing protein [Rhizobium pusense]|jgi:uncharacterized protein (DUF1330 family)|uniref:DUF1330 domain-containing protein n=4 Tax=Hyphomicrobiales TaxID=356 RepID=A0A1L9CJX8_9HYPH|nr:MULTISPECIES: DUF1330 domain-containing protein [Rhizobium/Agrobacterium group]AMD60630.1 hypothetical protein AWN88_21035 [Agrobacterium tumefaciens]AUC11035.1 hypothetical protein BLX90_13025 [Rhizobium sp. Y9]EKJ94108.1 hypothetical protein C241_19711 [Bradyrhizobium lupini HPC(L)]KIV62109.1 hypothetical protein SZ54_4232 [Rhizobium sp. UR51a]MBB2903880.1 uncharacterized protein (DUF1330 family) [Rhizobium sp. RAS22]MBM7323025.1 DUF1330 domain-containing protein [Agrobacterium sp. S2]M